MSRLSIFIAICVGCYGSGAIAAAISANHTRLILKTADKIAIYEGGNQDSRLQMAFMLSDGSSKEIMQTQQIGKKDDSFVIDCPEIISSNDSTTAIKISYNCKTAITPQPTPPPLPTCKPNFVLLGRNCYHFNTNKANWYEALWRCQTLGATLAHPMDVNENTLLKNYLINTIKQEGWWIGGTDEAKSGTEWVWAHTGAKIAYFDWYSGEPHNASPDENCLVYWYSSYKWGDHLCRGHTEKFICQQ